jgi:hypothetical protein
MKKVHPDEVRAFEDKERHQKEIEASRKLTDVFVPNGDSEQSYFNSILAEWVGTSLRPMSIVEDAGFVKAIRFANAAKTQLSIPSRQTVDDGVHIKASQCRLSLRLRLSDDNECLFFSLSSDIWTSLQHESFIILTLHYVDSEFEIHSWTLEVTEIPGKHDGDAIAAAVLARCFSWWRLDPKRCVIFLRDRASNMVKACESLHVLLNSLPRPGCWGRFWSKVTSETVWLSSRQLQSVAMPATAKILVETATGLKLHLLLPTQVHLQV